MVVFTKLNSLNNMILLNISLNYFRFINFINVVATWFLINYFLVFFINIASFNNLENFLYK